MKLEPTGFLGRLDGGCKGNSGIKVPKSWARLQTKGTVLIRWSSLQIAAENSGVFGATLAFDQLVTNFGVLRLLSGSIIH